MTQYFRMTQHFGMTQHRGIMQYYSYLLGALLYAYMYTYTLYRGDQPIKINVVVKVGGDISNT